MIFLAVDDESLALERITSKIKQTKLGEVFSFTDPKKVIDFINTKEIKIDIAFLDIEMRTMSGLALAKIIKEKSPSTNVVFVTGYSQYALDAFRARASGYLIKPITEDSIRNEIEYLMSAERNVVNEKKVKIQTFGNFEIFIGDKPCIFKYGKTKELLAYLIDKRGSFCYKNEIMAVLWEDKVDSRSLFSQLRNITADLIKTLKTNKCADIVIKKRAMICIIPTGIDCDYYNWLNGDIKAVNAYKGEYMSQYSWAEFALENIKV